MESNKSCGPGRHENRDNYELQGAQQTPPGYQHLAAMTLRRNQ